MIGTLCFIDVQLSDPRSGRGDILLVDIGRRAFGVDHSWTTQSEVAELVSLQIYQSLHLAFEVPSIVSIRSRLPAVRRGSQIQHEMRAVFELEGADDEAAAKYP